MNLGKVILAYRLHHHITVRQMADLMGVEYTKLWRFEQGRSISNGAWTRIFLWLLSEESNEPKQQN